MNELAEQQTESKNSPNREIRRRAMALMELELDVARCLERNAHKGDWRGMSIPQVLVLLDEELTEIGEALQRWNGKDARSEIADAVGCLLIMHDLLKDVP